MKTCWNCGEENKQFFYEMHAQKVFALLYKLGVKVGTTREFTFTQEEN